jgi:two-component system, response regulator
MMLTERPILLVEDNDVDADLAVRAFHRANIKSPLVRARDGVEALDYLFARGKHAAREVRDLPLFALLDLNIPKISGLSVLKAIREDERTKHLPVIILTSSSEEKDRLGAYNQFANSYVVKPLDYDQFVESALQLSLYWGGLNVPAPLKEAY